MAKDASKGTGGGAAQRDLYEGLYREGDAGAYQNRADEIVQGARDVADDFGVGDAIRGVYISKYLKDGAAMNGMGDLKISQKILAEGEKPTNGYLVNDTYYGTGAHEAGHLVVNELLKRNVMPDASNLERATARNKMKLEKAILKESARRYGSNPAISRYGSTKVSEKVAEAVSDVYSNKSSANPYSKTIVEVMKDIRAGKFKPVVKVTKSEMKI